MYLCALILILKTEMNKKKFDLKMFVKKCWVNKRQTNLKEEEIVLTDIVDRLSDSDI